MSCPNGGSAGIYGLLTRCCQCQGKFDFFTRASPRVRITDILDQGGMDLLLKLMADMRNS